MWVEEIDNTDPDYVAINTTDGTVELDEKLYIELTWPDKIPYNNRVLSGQIIQKEWILSP